jgi:hypothetical protein
MTALRETPALTTAPDFTADAPETVTPLSALPPLSARDFLHLNAIDAWASLAAGTRPSYIDLRDYYQQMHKAFEPGNGRRNPLDGFRSQGEEIAIRHGLTVQDEGGDPLRPDVDDAITGLITGAIWFGITTGHYTITGGRYRIPRRLRKYLEADGLGLPRPARRGWLTRCLRALADKLEAAR